MRNNKGFTILEVLIAMSIMIIILGSITSALSSFMKYSSRSSIEDQAQYDISNIIKLVENNIRSASKIESSVTINSNLYETDSKTIVLSEPVVNEYTIPIVDNSGKPLFDNVVIKLEKDSQNKFTQLRYIIEPKSGSTKRATNRIIYKSINPASSTHLFKYYKNSTTETTNYNEATMVKFSIDALIEYNPPIRVVRNSITKLLNFGI